MPKMTSSKLERAPKSVVMDTLVDFLDKELDSTLTQKPKGTPSSVSTPRELIQQTLRPSNIVTQAHIQATRGGSDKYRIEEGNEEVDISPAQLLVTKLMTVAFIVFLYFGFFKTSTTVSVIKSTLVWLFKTLKIGVPAMLTIIGNFATIAGSALKTVLIDMKGLNIAGFVGTIGLFFSFKWNKGDSAERGQSKLAETFHRVKSVLNDSIIEPIARVVVRPVLKVGYDIAGISAYLANTVLFGMKSLVGTIASAVQKGGEKSRQRTELTIVGGYPHTRATAKLRIIQKHGGGGQ